MRPIALRTVVPVLSSLVILGCGPAADDETSPECPAGKCDGLSASFKDLFTDMRKVDLADLVNAGAGLATKQLNAQLDNLPYASIALGTTEVYTTAERAKQDLTLHDLDGLTAGLAARYGDHDFVTRVNALRRAEVHAKPGRVFAEASFQLGGKLTPSFSFTAGGLPGQLGLLGAKGIKATVVAPYDGELSALYQAPLDAVKAMRGFVVPRSIEDLSAMTPGESLTLSSDGAVGLNVGIGVPIYLTTVGSAATIHAVVSAAARAALEGEVDIQLVRDQGDTVIVDVGVTGAKHRYFKLAAETRWGVEALAEANLEVGPLKLDVAGLAEKALEQLLNRKLQLLSAAYLDEQRTVRHTVARFAFDLGKRDEARDQALIQALRGDLRLAQALANRADPAVTQLLDLTRDARSSSSYLGVHFLSMRFFREKKDLAGSVVITTGPVSQKILFDELDQQSGSFFTTRGYKRGTVVSLRSDRGRLVDADLNLRLQLREGDKYTERDQILDHVDPLLALFLGKDAVAKIAALTDPLEQYIDAKCPVPSPTGDASDRQRAESEYRDCLEQLPNDTQVTASRQKAQATFDALLAAGVRDGLDPALDDGTKIAGQLFALKLAVQSSYQYPALWTGPKSSMVIDARLSEKAIASVLGAEDGRERFGAALRDVLYLLRVKRAKPLGSQQQKIEATMKGLEGGISLAQARAEGASQLYRQLQGLAGVSYESNAMGTTTLGGQAHLMIVDGPSDATITTITERKAAITAGVFDNLVKGADFGCPAHQAIGYALLLATHPSQTELLLNLDFKKDDNADYPDQRLHGRGLAAKLIDAGKYDLQSLIGQ